MEKNTMIDSDLSKHKLLIIAPHPDDETLGCGGTIAKFKDLGGNVYVLIICVGDVPQYDGFSRTKTRIEELKSVMDFFNVDDYEIALIGEEYHLKLDMLPQKDLIDLIEDKSKVSINKINPTIVALPFQHGYNQDHAAIFRAGFTACRPIPAAVKPFPRLVLSYEQPSELWSSVRFHPNLYNNIREKYLNMKLEAISLYKSQIRRNLHPRSKEGALYLAKLRGKEICTEAAEAFICHRMIF